MTYSLKIWNHPSTGAVRLYINGTNRNGVYFHLSRDGEKMMIGSKAIDTPHKFQKGNHYAKVNKDNDAARMVAEAFDLKVGDGSEGEFARACQIAADSIEIEE